VITCKTVISVLAIGAFCVAGTFARAQKDTNPSNSANQGSTAQSGAAVGSSSDRIFAMKAAQGGIAEVKMGQLAQDKGQSDSVKSFGKRMMTDHSKANRKLRSTAAQENMKLPTAMNAHDKEVYDKLSQRSGADFDRAYVNEMVTDHIQDIAEFKEEA
jgi:putative membrane protein